MIFELKSQLYMNLYQNMCCYQEKMFLTCSSDGLFKVFRWTFQGIQVIPTIALSSFSVVWQFHCHCKSSKTTDFANFHQIFPSVYFSSTETSYQYTAEADIVNTIEVCNTIIALLLHDLQEIVVLVLDKFRSLILKVFESRIVIRCMRSIRKSDKLAFSLRFEIML